MSAEEEDDIYALTPIRPVESLTSDDEPPSPRDPPPRARLSPHTPARPRPVAARPRGGAASPLDPLMGESEGGMFFATASAAAGSAVGSSRAATAGTTARRRGRRSSDARDGADAGARSSKSSDGSDRRRSPAGAVPRELDLSAAASSPPRRTAPELAAAGGRGAAAAAALAAAAAAVGGAASSGSGSDDTAWAEAMDGALGPLVESITELASELRAAMTGPAPQPRARAAAILDPFAAPSPPLLGGWEATRGERTARAHAVRARAAADRARLLAGGPARVYPPPLPRMADARRALDFSCAAGAAGAPVHRSTFVHRGRTFDLAVSAR